MNLARDNDSHLPSKPKKKGFWAVLRSLVVKAIIVFLVLSNVWVLAYKFFPVPITPLMLIRIQEQKAKGKIERCDYRWVNKSEIAEPMARAVIISEDQKFLDHWGFDGDAILYAIKRNTKGKRKIVGGSTISQQTAKNVFLFPARNFIRKGLEAYFTVLIEIWWSKERIMQVYLNVIEMGDGIYGCEAAAQSYFHHSAKKLNKSEAALIAAVLPNPIRYKVSAPTSFVTYRQKFILRRMNKQGKIPW